MRGISFSPLAAAFLLTTALPGIAMAQDLGDPGIGGDTTTSVAAPETTDTRGAEAGTTPSIQSSLGPYGDPGGIRAYLKTKGIEYTFSYIGETLGNPTGGFKQGAIYEGLVTGQVDVDLEKLAGLKGGALRAIGYNIHGRGLTTNNLLDVFTVSGIEAFPDTLLYEAWYEQKFADDKIAFRIGQLAADTEFEISQTAALFVSATFGFSANFGVNLPSGGPAFPLGTPGVRLQVNPAENLTLLIGLYNGDPAGPFTGVNSPIPQLRDRGGVEFRVKDPPLLLTEGQYVYKAYNLPGTVKLGYYHHFEAFADYAALPFATQTVRGNDGAYGIIDQTIYREAGTDDQGLSVFARAVGAPSDRNLIDIYVDGGFGYKGLIPGRDNDTLGLAAAYGRISPAVRNSDILGAATPLIRDYQALIEATYQIAVVDGFTLQPDFQYVIHPGANGVGDAITGQPLKDAAVFGLRATIVY